MGCTYVSTELKNSCRNCSHASTYLYIKKSGITLASLRYVDLREFLYIAINIIYNLFID